MIGLSPSSLAIFGCMKLLKEPVSNRARRVLPTIRASAVRTSSPLRNARDGVFRPLPASLGLSGLRGLGLNSFFFLPAPVQARGWLVLCLGFLGVAASMFPSGVPWSAPCCQGPAACFQLRAAPPYLRSLPLDSELSARAVHIGGLFPAVFSILPCFSCELLSCRRPLALCSVFPLRPRRFRLLTLPGVSSSATVHLVHCLGVSLSLPSQQQFPSFPWVSSPPLSDSPGLVPRVPPPASSRGTMVSEWLSLRRVRLARPAMHPAHPGVGVMHRWGEERFARCPSPVVRVPA